MRPDELSQLVNLLNEESTSGKQDDALISSLRNSYRFSPGFSGRVMRSLSLNTQDNFFVDLTLKMNSIFMKIAVTGVAAIILLSVSVFLSGGTLSLDSLLGLGNTSVESMICLLSGN